MRRTRWAILISTLFLATAAAAEKPLPLMPGCHERSAVVDNLKEKYGETVKAIGMQSDGMVLEIYVSPGGETWTAVVTRPDGITCLVMAGENWEDAPPVKHSACTSITPNGEIIDSLCGEPPA